MNGEHHSLGCNHMMKNGAVSDNFRSLHHLLPSAHMILTVESILMGYYPLVTCKILMFLRE